MTDNSNASPNRKLKTLVVQGVIGACTLAGTTAIPLLVQKYLNPPAPAPSVVAPAQPSPIANEAQAVTEAQLTPEEFVPPGQRHKDDRHRDKPSKP